MKPLLIAAIAAFLLLLSIQFIGVSMTNPPTSQDFSAPSAVASVLHRACYDCHSNQTRWPWYARVAPASWMVAHDVRDGRRHLNFSTWGDYASDPGTAAEKLRKLRKVMTKGSMPPWSYAMMHPQARLTRADRMLLADWAARGASIGESASDPASR